jgi:hypothetical protein
LNPGRRGGKPATNRLSYGAAYIGVHDKFNILVPATSLEMGRSKVHPVIFSLL